MAERVTKEIPAKPQPKRKRAPKRRAKAGIPSQLDCNVWPILAEPETAEKEIHAGKHDQCLILLEAVARSQGLASVVDACSARRKALGA